jgi:hypothetical protein
MLLGLGSNYGALLKKNIERIAEDLGRVHDLVSTVLSEELKTPNISLGNSDGIEALLEYSLGYLENAFLNLDELNSAY